MACCRLRIRADHPGLPQQEVSCTGPARISVCAGSLRALPGVLREWRDVPDVARCVVSFLDGLVRSVDWEHVKLGKQPAVHDPRTFQLIDFLDRSELPVNPPARNWNDKLFGDLGMMLNDKI